MDFFCACVGSGHHLDVPFPISLADGSFAGKMGGPDGAELPTLHIFSRSVASENLVAELADAALRVNSRMGSMPKGPIRAIRKYRVSVHTVTGGNFMCAIHPPLEELLIGIVVLV